MADTGEKIYLASETTAQEILSGLDNVVSNSDIANISTSLSAGIRGNHPYGYDFTSVRMGSLNQSEVSFTGKGTVIMYGSGTSGEGIIDGVSFTTYGGYDDSELFATLHFNNSLVVKNSGYYSVRYIVFLE